MMLVSNFSTVMPGTHGENSWRPLFLYELLQVELEYHVNQTLMHDACAQYYK